jgi:hypothetical protein
MSRPGFFLVGSGQHLKHGGRDNLPRDAVFVLQPSASLCPLIAALAQFIPVMIDLALRFAFHDKGNRLGELQMRSAVERGELLAFEAKTHGHHEPSGLT